MKSKTFIFDLEQPGIQVVPGIGEITITDTEIITKRTSKKFGLIKELKFQRTEDLIIWYSDVAIFIGYKDILENNDSEMITYYDECKEHCNMIKEMNKLVGGSFGIASPWAIDKFIEELIEEK